MKKKGCIIVFSGGQDSTTCLLQAIESYKKVVAVSFDYGQRHQKEIDVARSIAKELNVTHKVIQMDFFTRITKNALIDKKIT